MSRSKSLTIIFNRLLYHPKRPKAKFHVTSDQTPHLRRGSTHLILDERGNPIDSIDEKLSYLRILAICGRTIVRFMIPAHPPQNTPSAPPSPRHRPRLGKATCKHTIPPCQAPPRAAKQARPSPSMSPGRGAAARTAKPTSSHLPATLRTQPGAGRARAPLHRIHHLRGGG